jgi:Na+-transporting NADH:ubiquinone oxidoreductase subunit E
MKIRYSNVPKGLRGLGMAMLLTGLMALAFQCFAGIQL